MEERLTHLEIKIAYQERTIELLNQVIIERGREHDALVRRVARLERMIELGTERSDDGSA
jgi:uncharacterized coiled-coil protein SlyX